MITYDITVAQELAISSMKGNMKKLIALSTITLAVSRLSDHAFADTSACLITKTDTNRFFLNMVEDATAKTDEMGVTLKSFAFMTGAKAPDKQAA